MMDEAQGNDSTVNRIFRFEKLALILGFIIDSITLVSILLAIDLSKRGFALPFFVTPGLAFVIWLLAVYTYLAFLHSYWEKNQSDKGLAERFGVFLINDLILRFRNPSLLFPALVSVITLSLVAYYAVAYYGIEIYIGGPTEEIWLVRALLATLFLIPLFFVAVFVRWLRARYPTPVTREFRQQVEDNWEFLEESISSKLTRYRWITWKDLKDIAVIWAGVPMDKTNCAFILARYALEHPEQTVYGRVHRREDGWAIEGSDSVLIRLEDFPHDKCYYTLS